MDKRLLIGVMNLPSVYADNYTKPINMGFFLATDFSVFLLDIGSLFIGKLVLGTD